MATWNLSNGNKPNQDPLVLWEQLARCVLKNSANNNVVSVTVIRPGGGLNVQFQGATLIYGYHNKETLVSLLTREDASWWLSQPF